MPLGFKPCCADCKVFESPMWHKAGNGDVLCHACSNRGPQVYVRASEEKRGMSLRCRERSAGPKGRTNSSKGEYKSSRVRNQQNRRTMLKVQGCTSFFNLHPPYVCATRPTPHSRVHTSGTQEPNRSSLPSLPSGMMYRIGDVVSVIDVEGGIYYAQIRGFLRDQFAESFAVLTWLLPTRPDPVHFDPSHFMLGPEEEVARPMGVLRFVCHNVLDKSTSGCSRICCCRS